MPEPKHAFYHIKLVREGRPEYSKQINDPAQAASFFREQIGSCLQERFAALFLNARNVPIGWQEISRGSVSASIVHPREVFLPAISLIASSLILSHNHPSSDPTPSQDDVDLTRRMKSAGEILGIEVLDHLVVTEDDHISLKERGLL